MGIERRFLLPRKRSWMDLPRPRAETASLRIYVGDWGARVWSKEQPVKGRTPTLEGRKGVPYFRHEEISTGLPNFPRKHSGSCTREIAWESAVDGDGQTESRLIIRRGA